MINVYHIRNIFVEVIIWENIDKSTKGGIQYTKGYRILYMYSQDITHYCNNGCIKMNEMCIQIVLLPPIAEQIRFTAMSVYFLRSRNVFRIF